jgi:hypothetical protein
MGHRAAEVNTGQRPVRVILGLLPHDVCALPGTPDTPQNAVTWDGEVLTWGGEVITWN